MLNNKLDFSFTRTAIVANPITNPTFTGYPSEVMANQDYTITWTNPSNATKVYLHESGSNGFEKQYPFLDPHNLPTAMDFNKQAEEIGVAYTYQLSACNAIECSPLPHPTAVVKVRTNHHPEIQWTHEAPTGPFHPDDETTLSVTVSDKDETLATENITFFTNECDDDGGRCAGGFFTKPLYDDLCGCYRINWNPLNQQTAGSWSVLVSAEVTDSAGAVETITAEVQVDHNRQPRVTLESRPETVKQYDRVSLLATAEDKDGEIASVQFWVNGSPYGAAIETPPYTLQWTPQSSGSARLEARATDNEDSTHTSKPHTLQVIAAEKPPVPSGLAILTVDEQPQPDPSYTGAYRVTWNAMPSTPFYKLEQKQDGAYGDFQELSLANQEIPGHYLPNQSAGRYHYRVYGCNPDDCSEPSTEISITVAETLAAPQGLTARPDPDLNPADATPQFTGSYTLAWNRVGGDDALEYHLQERFGGPETPASESGLWQTRYRGANPHFVIEDKSPGLYAYQVLACLKDNPELCSAQNELVTVNVVTPVLTAAKLACDGTCIDFAGLGLDPDVSLTLMAVAEPSITQTFTVDDDRLVRTSATELQVTIQPENPLHQHLLVEGVRAMVTNPNGAQGGITAYGNRTTEIIGETSASPAIGPNGVMYVATGNQLHALKADTGEDIQQPGWPFTAGGKMRATPRIDSVDGTIYVGAMDQNLYAITPDAIEKWRLPTHGSVISPVVLDQARSLYFGTFIDKGVASQADAACGGGGVLYAINAEGNAEDETAQIKWTFPTECGIAKEPVLAGDNTLYFSTVDSNQIYAITRDNRGPGKLDWQSTDDPELWDEIGNWQPAPSQETDFLGIARLYRGLLQPPLPFSRKILTFWTYQLAQGETTHVGTAEAFLQSATGRINFPESLSNEAFVDALYKRIFPTQGQPRITWGGLSYGPAELILQLEEGFSRAQIAVLFTQSQEYTDATSALFSRSFDYLYDPDYRWGGGPCTDEDPYNCDSDGDKLPDWWEILYFGNLDQDGTGDHDGDGQNNEDAYQGNNDPCVNGCYNGIKETPPEPSGPQPLDSTALAVSTEIGSLPGEFRVNEAGAATYSIPLSLPAGTAGVSPQLALNYSSQAGNGLLGQGWQLRGLSSISRCRQTPGQDNHSAPITWGSDDRFCLDGQRLVLDSGSSYGAPGSQYRSEIDSYALITAHGGSAGNPAYFTVERKDGSINYYGYNQQDNQSQHTPAGFATLSWAISRTEDSAGNPIDFFYDLEGGHRIREIRYGYGDSSSPSASVAFEYKTREDIINGYIAGAPLTTSQRLHAITVHGVQNAALRRYEVDYLKTNYERDVLSRIEKLRECVGGVCHADTEFTWRLPAIFFAAKPTSSIELSNQDDAAALSPRPADINGDGRMDIVWAEAVWSWRGHISDHYFKYVLAEAQGFSSVEHLVHYSGESRAPYRWEMLDYNADGRADLMIYDDRFGGWKLHQSVNTFRGWRLSSSSTTVLDEKDARFIDINGDGLTDAVMASGYQLLEPAGEKPSSKNFYHFGAKQPWRISIPWPFGQEPGDTISTYLNPDVSGDFDGDGQVDLVLMHTKQHWAPNLKQDTRAYIAKVHNNQLVIGTQVMNYEQTSGFENGSDDRDATALERHPYIHRKLQAVDINSDGLVDLVLHDTSGDVAYRYWLNTGAGLAAPVDLGRFPKNAQPSWFDYEGDGDTDLVWRIDEGDREALKLRLWQNDQQGYAAEESFLSVRKDGQDMFLDMNGDGSTDRVEFADNHLYVYQSSDHEVAANVIEKIANGLGAVTQITFGSSVTSGHYARLGADELDQHCSSGINKSDYLDSDEVAAWCTQYKEPFYEALNEDWQHNHTLGKTSPVLEMTGTQFLVTRVESSAPATDSETAGAVDPEATSAISYFYGRARLQAGGRGLLGFERVRTVDEQSGIRTTTQYRQDFPFLGYPQRTETHTPAGNLLSEADNTWVLHGWQSDFPQRAKAQGTTALGALKPYLATSVEKAYDFIDDGQTQGGLLKTVTTTTEQDAHGNVIHLDITTEGGGNTFSTKTANDYGSGQSVNFQNSEHNFNSYVQLGRLLQTTVIHERSKAGIAHSAIRHSAFSYYDSGDQAGLLKQEILEPDDPLRLVTRYEYDRFGNKTLVEQSAADVEPRTQRWAYNTSGRFIDKEINGYDQLVSEVLDRNDAGQATKIIDTAGVISQITYDAFGRQVYSYSSTGAQSSTLMARASYLCPTSATTQQRDYSGGGSEAITCFDNLGRRVRQATRAFDDGWNYVDTEYDPLGRVKHQSEPYRAGATAYWTSHRYDRLGRVTGTDLPGIHNSNGSRYDLILSYDGYTTISANPKGQRQSETKNAMGEKVRVQDNANNTLEFTHGAEGQLLQVINRGNGSRNLVTTMGYDLLGRKIAMSDPDKGNWQYNYNGYGELIQQTDAKGQRVENTYDLLGRLIERRDIDDSGERVKTSQWLYNNTQTTGEGGVPPTALAQVKEFAADPDTISYRKLYSYDELGRPSETVTSLADDGSDDHYEKTNYDAYSRPFQIFDAGGDGSWNNSAIRHHYNQYGYLYQVVDAELLNLATAEQFYTILNMDARGNVTEHLNGNGITTVKTYDPATGRLLGQTASVLGIGDIQQLSYDWDDLGNLTRRQDQSGDKDLSETFRYDELNRLTNAQVAGRQAQTLRYDDLGNITHKSDVGDYSYAGQCANKNYGPHAVCHTSDGVSYDYDANGNMTSDSSGRNLQYTTFDKPDAIKKGDHTTEFKYGPDRKRYLRIDTDSSGSNDKITETRSIGNIEKITKDGTTEIKRHLPGGALITLTVTQKNNETQYGSRTIQYLHKDHLGSLDVITDSGGQIANAGKALYSFDAWGQRRNALSWEALLSAELTGFDTNITTRGYTGHEMLDQVGLIHMNGRIYDPRLARFLQADPFIQTVSDTQMYNRYSYVRNNPLNATDPSGYFIATLAGFIAYAAGANAVVTGIIVGIAAFAETMMNGGNFADALKNGIISGVAAGAFTSMRSGFDFASATWGETAILGLKFGAVGGITSVLQGGKFGHGFVSAGVSAFTGKALGGTKFGASLGRGDQAVSQIVIGGTVSKATGGKFANGAATAAFQAVVAAAASGSRNRPGFTEGGVEVDYSQLESEGDYQLVDDHLASLVGDSSVNQASLAIAGTELGFHYTSARLSATAFTSRDVTSGLMRNAYLRSSRQVAIGGGAVMSFGLMPVSTVSGVAWHALDTHLKGVPMTVEGAAASILIDRTLSPGFEALGRASGHRFGEVMWNINQDILGYGIGQAGP